MTAAAEIARATVSATNRFGHETGKPRKFGLSLRTNRRFCEFPPPITSASPDVAAPPAKKVKSQPRNGAGEIFMTAAAEIARATVSATNRFGHETGKPRKFARK
jgi:hypothetical protein